MSIITYAGKIIKIVVIFFIFLTACESDEPIVLTNITSKYETIASETITPYTLVTPVLETTLAVAPSKTTESDNDMSNGRIPPSRTPLSGEIVTSPDTSCQLVPEVELTKVNDVPLNVHTAGKFYLCRGWPSAFTERTAFDLDTGFVGIKEDIGTDLYFIITSPTIDSSIEYHLNRINGAHIFETTSRVPDFDECNLAAAKEDQRILLVAEGLSTCWVTNEGRVAFVLVEELNTFGWGSISISFVTWEK
jgi:hypothetical protein